MYQILFYYHKVNFEIKQTSKKDKTEGFSLKVSAKCLILAQLSIEEYFEIYKSFFLGDSVFSQHCSVLSKPLNIGET